MITTTLTQGIVELLNVIYGDCRGVGRVLIGRGSATTAAIIPAGQRFGYLPEILLRELEYATPDDLRLAVATTDQAGGRLLDLPAVWTELPLEPEFDRRLGWIVPDETMRAARANLDAFAVRPSFVVDQAWSLLAGWMLDAPLRLDVPEEAARAERVQRALAETLGGLTGEVRVEVAGGSHASGLTRHEILPAWSPARPALRLPGSREHSRGASGHLVQLARLDVARRYPITAIEQALEPTSSTETTRPAARRRKEATS